MDAKLFSVAIARKRVQCEGPQYVIDIYTTVQHMDGKLFTEVLRRVCGFTAQGLPNTAWSCTTVRWMDKTVFAEALRRVSEFNLQGFP